MIDPESPEVTDEVVDSPTDSDDLDEVADGGDTPPPPGPTPSQPSPGNS